MSRFWWIALCLMLAACSAPEEPKKAEAPKKDVPAPDVFEVNLDTSKGKVVIEVHKDWAPMGAQHLFELVNRGYYDGNRFFRVTRAYVQWGVNGDPQVSGLWSTANLRDDPVKQSNLKGTVSYAKIGPNSRATQLFINMRDNKDLDKQGFAPVGKVISGMEVVESFYDAYGDMPPRGQGPDPTKIETQGNAYLESRFPRLDFVKKATIQ
ncbi:MAG TPA: peptidylprolyl isomerase [Candidatus Acidoferrales bacterium]|nr:peptidylprolyl isomerase [Candidatus Acidoferrales bacterium]